jgi:hypothetical protein
MFFGYFNLFKTKQKIKVIIKGNFYSFIGTTRRHKFEHS